MIKKFLIILFLLLSLLLFSIEHNLGFSFQGQYAMMVNFDISIGINDEIYFSKYFGLENILLIGYNLDRTYGRPGILPDYDGVSFTYYIYPNLRFGNNRAKFFFTNRIKILYNSWKNKNFISSRLWIK